MEKAIEKRKEEGEKLKESAKGNTEPKADILEISEAGMIGGKISITL